MTNLDREKTAQYDIAVGCTDFGFPPLENTAKFLVIVKDENDNAPVFSRRSYVTTIKENRTVGAVVAQLTVTDYDEGRNADVTFRVAGAYGDDFEILDNGTMIATVALDREVTCTHPTLPYPAFSSTHPLLPLTGPFLAKNYLSPCGGCWLQVVGSVSTMSRIWVGEGELGVGCSSLPRVGFSHLQTALVVVV